MPPCSRPCCVHPLLSRPVPSRARRARARPHPAAGPPLLRGARCRARGSKDGGLRAILGAPGLFAAGRLRVGHPLPRLGLPLPRGAELGRQLGGIQLAPRPHHHGLRLHPGHRCVAGRVGAVRSARSCGGAGPAWGRGCAAREAPGGAAGTARGRERSRRERSSRSAVQGSQRSREGTKSPL